MKRHNLINNLLIINCIALFISFSFIYFSLNYVAKNYVHQMTSNSMKSNFSILDSINAQKKIPEQSTKDQDSVFVWAYFAIYDQGNHLKYANDTKKAVSQTIYHYINQHNLWSKTQSKRGIFVPIKNKTYYVMSKDYQGVFEDGLVTKTNTKRDKNYHVINFADITYTKDLINQINTYLLISLMITFLVTLFILRKTFLGIRESIQSVQAYISNLWREKKYFEETQKQIVFSDFDPLLQESKAMALRIQKAEDSQLKFFQNASHELRTPLMSIQGYTEGVKEGIIPSHQAYDVILQESQKMKQLVDDIMLLSRIDSNSDRQFDKVVLNDIIKNCVSYFKPIANQQHISLNVSLGSQSQIIHGDEELIQKAISNIISNALRYAKTRIDISLVGKQIHISNDGSAISEKDLPNIFERFYKGEGGQTGIGLAMVKEIMTQHQGNIQVESNFRNTQFILSFDCHKVAT